MPGVTEEQIIAARQMTAITAAAFRVHFCIDPSIFARETFCAFIY